jgi:hypothetical protein
MSGACPEDTMMNRRGSAPRGSGRTLDEMFASSNVHTIKQAIALWRGDRSAIVAADRTISD